MSDVATVQSIDFAKLAEAYEKVCRMDAPLLTRLTIFEAAVREYGVPFAEAYDELVARLKSGNAGASTPGVGDDMPGFVLPDVHGRLVSLDELLRPGPVVLSLNRGHWCEYCGIELVALASHRLDFAAYGATVVSVMPERQAQLRTVNERTGVALTLLADADNGYALSLGLAVWLGERVRKLYLDLGIRVDLFQGNESWFVPIPATFVVARNGRIAARFIDPDFRRRMDVDDILNALRSMNDRA